MKHLHRDLLDPQHIAGKAGHLIGMEQQGVFLIGAVFGIETLWVERGVEVAGISVGIAIDRRPGAIQGALHIVNTDQAIAWGGSEASGQANRQAQGVGIKAGDRARLGRGTAVDSSREPIAARGMAEHMRRI